MTRRLTALLTAVVTAALTLVTGLLLPGVASAHSTLVNSNPPVGGHITEPPEAIMLVFSEELRDFAPQLAITAGDLPPVTVTPLIEVDTVVADISDLDIETDPNNPVWKVGYRVVADDGHPVSGVLEFSVYDQGQPIPDSAFSLSPTVPDSAETDTADADEPTPADEPTARPTEETASDTSGTDGTDGTSAAEADAPGHDNGSMVAWFIGGGVLIVLIVAVAVVVARRHASPQAGGGGD